MLDVPCRFPFACPATPNIEVGRTGCYDFSPPRGPMTSKLVVLPRKSPRLSFICCNGIISALSIFGALSFCPIMYIFFSFLRARLLFSQTRLFRTINV